MKKTLLFLTLLLLTACQAPPQPAAPAHARLLARASTLVPTRTPPPSAPTATAAPTHTPTATDSPTEVPTATALPTLAPTATQVVTPTASVPQVTVLEQANCRYGPGQAYLYSHGLYAGDTGLVDGRNYSGSWLWILPANLERHCWVSAVVVEAAGDVKSAPVVQSRLPKSTLYGSPQSVEADRDGDQVTVTWEPVWMTEDDDRGYLIEATVCQNGARISVAVHTDKPSYTFTDGRDCSGDSGGRLYTVEKHGYTAPVPIPWP